MPVGVVTACRPFLFPVAGDDCRIDIQSDPLQGADLAKEPTVGIGLYPFVGQHVEAGEQPHDGLVAGCLRPAEQPHQRAVHACRLGVCEPTGAAPDGNNELLDQLQRRIAPVRLRLRQTPAGHCLPKPHVVEHLLEQGQAAPGRDLTVAETDRKSFSL